MKCNWDEDTPQNILENIAFAKKIIENQPPTTFTLFCREEQYDEVNNAISSDEELNKLIKVVSAKKDAFKDIPNNEVFLAKNPDIPEINVTKYIESGVDMYFKMKSRVI